MNKKSTISGLTILMTLFTTLLSGQKPCLCDLEFNGSKYFKADSLYTGAYECINNHGVITATGYIKNGLLDSTVYFKSNGKISEIIWYHDNKPDTRRLYQNAWLTTLVINVKMLNDQDFVEHGPWERYFLNGKIKKQEFFDNGKPVGLWRTWNARGQLISETDFRLNPVIARYHQYKKNKHVVIVSYTEEATGRRIRYEEIIEE